MDQEKIGKFIQKLRKEKKITQQELADRLNITDRAVSHWENGRRLPDLSLLEPLSKELNISIPELLNGEYKNKSNHEKSDDITVLLNYLIEIREHYNFKKLIISSLLFFSLYILITIIYFKSRFHGLNTIDFGLLKDRINLIPFANIYASITTNNLWIFFKNVLINSIIAAIISLYTNQFITNSKKYIKSIIVFNIILELIKFISLIGFFDINDIIIRVSIGLMIYSIFIRKKVKKL